MLGGAALLPGQPVRHRAIRGWAHVWVRFHRCCARYILGIRTRIEGAPPAGPALVAVKHQSMYETMEIMLLLDQPAMVLKRELADIPLWGWVVRRYGAIPVDRVGRRGGAAPDDARRRGGDRRGPPDHDLPRRHAGGARRAPAASAGLRRPLPGAEAAGGSGRGRQRPALAAAQLRQAPGDRHHALRRDDPARPAARRDRGRGPRRDQRAGAGG